MFTCGLVLIPIGCLLAAVLALRQPFPWAGVCAMLLGLAICPHRKWPALEAGWCRLFGVWAEIFHTTLIYEKGLLPEYGDGEAAPLKDFILTVHPHGVIPITGMLIWGATFQHGLHPDAFGGSGAALAMPFFRQFLKWNGGYDVSKHVVKVLLKKVHSFSVFSGGISEMMATHNDKETFLLSKRIGIIALAKENGKTIVPVVAFGTTQHFKRWPSPDNATLQWMSKKLRAAFLLPYGRFGLPIPMFAKTTIVFGSPIDVAEATVEDAHKQWMSWFAEASAKYAKLAGVSDREIVIL